MLSDQRLQVNPGQVSIPVISTTSSARSSIDTLRVPHVFKDENVPPTLPTGSPPNYTAMASEKCPGIIHNKSLPLSPAQSSTFSPILIPQLTPFPSSPFIPAYHPSLLSRGIPQDTWLSFLAAVSALHRVPISKRALSHASDMGRSVISVPSQMGRDLATHTVTCSKTLTSSARQGNLGGVVGGVVGLTFGSVGQVIAEAFRLPFKAVGTVARRPMTTGERVQKFLVAANEEWLRPRGLEVKVMGTRGSEEVMGKFGTGSLLGEKGVMKGTLGLEKLEGLTGEILLNEEKVGKVEIGMGTLWLVVVEAQNEGRGL